MPVRVRDKFQSGTASRHRRQYRHASLHLSEACLRRSPRNRESLRFTAFEITRVTGPRLGWITKRERNYYCHRYLEKKGIHTYNAHAHRHTRTHIHTHTHTHTHARTHAHTHTRTRTHTHTRMYTHKPTRMHDDSTRLKREGLQCNPLLCVDFCYCQRFDLSCGRKPFLATVLSHWDFFHGKFGLLSLGKASCDEVALPNLQCTLGVLVF